VLLPLLRGPWQRGWTLLLPVIGLGDLLAIEPGEHFRFGLFGYALVPVRVDRLSLAFGYIFHIAALLAAVYALHVRDTVQHAAGIVYAGAAVGAVFAGDLITLFVYWEAMAVASVFLIWARRTERAYRAGMRYLVVQVGSGVLLMTGAIVHAQTTGSVEFGPLALEGISAVLIFLGFGIKCAFPLLHNWLSDAYPEATVTGTVFLSAFTTKAAIYALARGFAGTEVLVYIGVAMVVFPIFYALMENGLQRVLAYSLIQQLGFMVTGIGVGSELALAGVVGHAFVSTIYQALLFMAVGAVLHRTGTEQASELGALHRSMPISALCCAIGAASIMAAPLFSGFVAKSLTIDAVAVRHMEAVWLVLMLASASVVLHTGIKVPLRAFFGRGPVMSVAEAPANMLVAMGLAAAASLALGVHSPLLYSLLPYPVAYEPYTVPHVIGQLQLLLFSALVLAVCIRHGLYPRELRSTLLDFDWVYRKGAPRLVRAVWGVIWPGYTGILEELRVGLDRFIAGVFRHHGPGGALARTWPTGSTALWVAVLLGGLLVLYYTI
jgi:multicomponent Na+:H+ antiporter subunit D